MFHLSPIPTSGHDYSEHPLGNQRLNVLESKRIRFKKKNTWASNKDYKLVLSVVPPIVLSEKCAF